MNNDKKLGRNTIIQVAAAVRADPRTVKKVIDGLPVRGSVRDAIEDELRRRGKHPHG